MDKIRFIIPDSGSKLIYLLLGLLCVLHFDVTAQKYNFINFNVENGLAQSQVTSFAQDANNELLIGTFGGLSIFDGTNFSTYNKANGLLQNRVQALACDKKQRIWIGTNSGISCFDGKIFRNYNPNKIPKSNSVKRILTDVYGNVWALVEDHLFRFNGIIFEPVKADDAIKCMTLDNNGKLWIFAYQKGIFVFNNKGWNKEIDVLAHQDLWIAKMTFGAYSGTLYAMSSHGMLVAENGKLKSPEWIAAFPGKGFLKDIIEDKKGNVWLSLSDGGAWLYSKKDWIHYTYQNGLTDESVEVFYEDGEGNVWLGTNGVGIFRYTGSVFTYYDRSSGLASPSVMGITQNKNGTIFLAGNSSGLYKLNKGIPQKVAMPGITNHINALAVDSLGDLWIGTEQAALWKYDGQKADAFKPSVTQNIYNITHLQRDGNVMWIAASSGLFKLENNELSKEEIIGIQVYTCMPMGKDSLLLGSLKGAFIYRTDLHELLPKPFVENSNILCFDDDGQRIAIGTDDKGVLIWNKQTKTFNTINHKVGLTCDYVYSLLHDRNGNLWVGTGCGIDKVTFNDKGGFHIRSFGRSDGLLGVENNSNASFEDREGYLWFGTTKGVFRYNPYSLVEKQHAPKVVLQSVKLFSKEMTPGLYSDSTTPFTHLEWKPVLPPGQNHLSFSFKGIYLCNPEKIKYRYQLVGVDKSFTETDQNTVVYPNLPAGKYLFKVWASDADGNWYNNAASYPFTIKASFYTTLNFKLGIGLLLVSLFLGGVYYRNRQKEYRRRWQEKLREEQQAILRQRTAEDFHDEIGNKLTRINLLATVAESKLQRPPEELKKILQQIQTNVGSLYRGSKDIIWSLQPDSDYLDEIIFRVRQNTEEFLEDSAMKFEYRNDGNFNTHIKLPIDYSRNIIMIFKEAVNNAVKHSGCSEIILSVSETEEQHIVLRLQDNGKGYNQEVQQPGNGLGNMQNRAKRIGALLRWTSTPGGGTEMELRLKL